MYLTLPYLDQLARGIARDFLEYVVIEARSKD